MSQNEPARGRAVVMQPGEGKSFWQPVPASGHSDPKLVPADTGFDGMSMGFQTIAPRSRVREHSHADQIELQICFKGSGTVRLDGAPHPIVPGTACFLGYDVKHEIINDTDEELVMMWVIAPAGWRTFSPQSAGRESPARPRPSRSPGPTTSSAWSAASA